MHTVFALLCFVVVIHWLIFPYPSGLLHWHCGNLTIVPVPAKQPWWIWINTSCEFIMNDCVTTTKQSTTKPCAYFLGYTVTPSDCTCELLETSCRDVYVLQHYKGYYIVRLSGCNKTPPWKVITPTQRKLQSMRPRDVGSQLSILKNPRTTRQVARGLYKGTFVPGFVLVSSGRLFALTMNGKFVECVEVLPVLTYVRPDDYSWINFAPGDEIAASAVVSGYWRDETPLHVINVHIRHAWKPGFYSAVTWRIYVRSTNYTNYNKILASVLLIENYWVKITIRNQDPADWFPVSWDDACVWSECCLLLCHYYVVWPTYSNLPLRYAYRLQ